MVESGLMSDLHVGRFDVVISMCVWYETLDLDLERSRQTPNMRYQGSYAAVDCGEICCFVDVPEGGTERDL